jgi:hypothetical protein
MNERIKELADKAIEDMPGAWNIPDEFCEKFAELIVRECTNVVQNQGAFLRFDQLVKKIKQHFGVDC